ncbi:MAG: hypothetical protein PF495_15130 [Spirochaetales bacterium]|jgi:uncharacterized UBP type Zn finger protein|nr:hypothetical protein [Spirochaetales bacterium]
MMTLTDLVAMDAGAAIDWLIEHQFDYDLKPVQLEGIAFDSLPIRSSVSSDVVGPILLEMLGIPVEKCKQAQINLKSNEAVTVDVVYLGELKPRHRHYGEWPEIYKQFKVVDNS